MLQELENSSSVRDIAIWRRLKQNFAAELARVRNKVTEVEANLTPVGISTIFDYNQASGDKYFFLLPIVLAKKMTVKLLLAIALDWI